MTHQLLFHFLLSRNKPCMYKHVGNNTLVWKNWDNDKLQHIRGKWRQVQTLQVLLIGTSHLPREHSSPERHPKLALCKNCGSPFSRWNPSAARRANTYIHRLKGWRLRAALPPAPLWAFSSGPKKKVQKKCIKVQKLLPLNHATSIEGSHFKYKGTSGYGTFLCWYGRKRQP